MRINMIIRMEQTNKIVAQIREKYPEKFKSPRRNYATCEMYRSAGSCFSDTVIVVRSESAAKRKAGTRRGLSFNDRYRFVGSTEQLPVGVYEIPLEGELQP
jgi:hypothetical protein